MKSQYEELLKEDYEQFRELAKQFKNIDMTNIEGLRQLTVDSWLLATRWSDIQSNASLYADKKNKTEFQNWAYQKYRQLQELHITCRSWYRLAVEDYKANLIMEG